MTYLIGVEKGGRIKRVTAAKTKIGDAPRKIRLSFMTGVYFLINSIIVRLLDYPTSGSGQGCGVDGFPGDSDSDPPESTLTPTPEWTSTFVGQSLPQSLSCSCLHLFLAFGFSAF